MKIKILTLFRSNKSILVQTDNQLFTIKNKLCFQLFNNFMDFILHFFIFLLDYLDYLYHKMNAVDCGYWEVVVEPNGRIKLPNALLKLLDESERKHFTLSRGFGKNLLLWTQSAYNRQLDFFNSLDMNILKNKKLRNAFVIGISNMDIDTQNRLVIPKDLIQYADINKEMVIVLDNGMMEFWDKQTYNNEFNISPEDFMLLNQEIHLEQNKNREGDRHVS